jgi:tRNA(fMet)-specific endonuclease VapC
MEYLLDTNICIYIIKKNPLFVLEKFFKIPFGNIAISSITYSELQYGIYKSSNPQKNKEALESFVSPLIILDYDFKAGTEYGKIRADLERMGTPIGPLDTLIASHALSLNMTLVTNNEREFSRIKNLKIENWTKI